MNFIPRNSPQPHIFKFRTNTNDMEDAKTSVVGTTTTPPSTGSQDYVR